MASLFRFHYKEGCNPLRSLNRLLEEACMISSLALAATLVLPAQAGPAPQNASAAARADVVILWNDAVLHAIKAENTPPPIASRNLAIVHAAVFDAVNGLTPTHQ